MKKLITKILCLVLSVACLFSSTACFGGGDDIELDETKTQLYVGLVPSGYGNAWLKSAITRFEETYKNYEFQPGSGKKGAQVIIDDVSYGGSIGTSLPGARYQVIYTSDVNLTSLVNDNLLYDMSSIVNERFDDKDEQGNPVSNSIADKFLSSDQADCYKRNGKTYVLPFVAGDDAISYDRDLFEEKGYFFVANNPNAGDYTAKYRLVEGGKQYILGSADDYTLSMGRDGKAGTYDDGLPATYEQFYFLMEAIAADNITPITWSGMYASYLTQFLYGMWANNEGAEKMKMNYTLTGTATDLIDSISANGVITYKPATEINDDNGYLLHNQVGKYYALDFLDNIIEILKNKDAKGYEMAFKRSIDHLNSQDNFLKSVVNSENDSARYKRIAMFHDGCYWENEASGTFVAMGEGYGKKDRKIGWMPNPHPKDELAYDDPNFQKTVFLGSGSAYMFMNGNIKSEYLDIATKFVQFMHTRESLVEFNRITSMVRPFNYVLTDADKEEMTYFGQSMYDKYKASDFFEPASNNPVYLRNYNLFSVISSNNWRTLGENLNSADIPSTALKELCDAKTYFKGMQNYFTLDTWNKNYLGKK